MSTSAILRIRQTIQCAVEAESKSNTLGALVSAALPRLHRSLQISVSDREAHLKEYLREYIHCAPDSLEALTKIATETDTLDAFHSILETAKQYFLRPPSLLQEQPGLYGLLGEAYLVHRLIEEMDDRVNLSFGRSISPIDMTLANLLVHSLLGEKFANELDLAVFLAMERFSTIEDLKANPLFVAFMQRGRVNASASSLSRGPSLIESTEILLNVNHERDERVLH